MRVLKNLWRLVSRPSSRYALGTLLGFAIHDVHAAHRFHHVTFGRALVLDLGSADFVAVRK